MAQDGPDDLGKTVADDHEGNAAAAECPKKFPGERVQRDLFHVFREIGASHPDRSQLRLETLP